MKTNHILLAIIVIFAVIIAAYFFGKRSRIQEPAMIAEKEVPALQRKPFRIGTEKKTVNDVLEYFGEESRNKLVPYFSQVNISYPPEKLSLLFMKDEHLLELWASNEKDKHTFIRSYGIKKLSGTNGPKLREGDRQVPEGVYKITSFNPNSSYHLSMKLNYPNEFDLLHAKEEGRTELGTDIFIHGKALSIGCLAMGDKTIEELFVLSRDVGIKNILVVISPNDPRKQKLEYDETSQPSWIGELYLDIEKEFSKIL